MPRFLSLIIGVLLVALLLAACNDEQPAATPTAKSWIAHSDSTSPGTIGLLPDSQPTATSLAVANPPTATRPLPTSTTAPLHPSSTPVPPTALPSPATAPSPTIVLSSPARLQAMLLTETDLPSFVRDNDLSGELGNQRVADLDLNPVARLQTLTDLGRISGYQHVLRRSEDSQPLEGGVSVVESTVAAFSDNGGAIRSLTDAADRLQEAQDLPMQLEGSAREFGDRSLLLSHRDESGATVCTILFQRGKLLARVTAAGINITAADLYPLATILDARVKLWTSRSSSL